MQLSNERTVFYVLMVNLYFHFWFKTISVLCPELCLQLHTKSLAIRFQSIHYRCRSESNKPQQHNNLVLIGWDKQLSNIRLYEKEHSAAGLYIYKSLYIYNLLSVNTTIHNSNNITMDINCTAIQDFKND